MKSDVVLVVWRYGVRCEHKFDSIARAARSAIHHLDHCEGFPAEIKVNGKVVWKAGETGTMYSELEVLIRKVEAATA